MVSTPNPEIRFTGPFETGGLNEACSGTCGDEAPYWNHRTQSHCLGAVRCMYGRPAGGLRRGIARSFAPEIPRLNVTRQDRRSISQEGPSSSQEAGPPVTLHSPPPRTPPGAMRRRRTHDTPIPHARQPRPPVIVGYTREWTVVEAKADPTSLSQGRWRGFMDGLTPRAPHRAGTPVASGHGRALSPVGVQESHQVFVFNPFSGLYGPWPAGHGPGRCAHSQRLL